MLEEKESYRRARHSHLHLAAMHADELAKLLTHAFEQTEPVVLRQRLEEVAQRGGAAAAAAASLSQELVDDLRFVGRLQLRHRQHGRQLAVALEQLRQRRHGARDAVERRALDRCRVLIIERKKISSTKHTHTLTKRERERERERERKNKDRQHRHKKNIRKMSKKTPPLSW